MAEPQTPDKPAPADEKLLTLSEISQRTGISMPTLQRYKKTYQDRLPSVGIGRKQRYPERALPVFAELRSENAGRRGRPRKDAAAAAKRRPGRPARRPAAVRVAGRRGRAAGSIGSTGSVGSASAASARGAAKLGRRGRPGRPRKLAGRPAQGGARAGRPAKAAAGRRGAERAKTEGLLTLTQISKTTGISYPTLVRYVRLYSNRLAHAGKGRARRFYPEAVDVFRSLRQESGRGGRRPGSGRGHRAVAGAARRGRPPKSAAAGAGAMAGRLEAILAQRVRDLEKFRQDVEKRFSDLVRGLQKLR